MKTSFNLILILLNFCLLFICCQHINSAKNNEAFQSRTKLQSKDKSQNTPSTKSKVIPADPLELNEEIEIEPPRTAEPPPSPPVIEEIPEEEIENDVYLNIPKVVVNGFKDPTKTPLSTFSIDVDQASYSQVRELIMDGEIPPANMVRIEEMINYFDYDYHNPEGEIPFSVNTEISTCPWNTKHQLVHIGLQGRKIPKENIPANNLVFLLDVSCLLYTSPSPRDATLSRMPSSA